MVDNGADLLDLGTSAVGVVNRIGTANMHGISVDQRDDNESRQTVRLDDGKPKWALGRTASAKIREGLGFKRSMSTQDV